MRSILRVVVVDDHEVVRSGLKSLLEREPDIHVVAAFRSGEEMLLRVEELSPHVLLLDYRLPGKNGAEVCREVVRICPMTSVLILTSLINEEAFAMSLDAGAYGFLTKDLEVAGIPDAVRACARRVTVIAPAIAENLRSWARQHDSVSGLDALAANDVKVLGFLALGLSNRDIGLELGISQHTAKAHVGRLMRKMGVQRRAQAVATGLERGMI